MPSEAHAHAVLRRAIERRQVAAAWATAMQLGGNLQLPDALALTLLVLDREPPNYARLALRWHARFCAEREGISLAEAQLLLDLLCQLERHQGELRLLAGRTLRGLLEARGERVLAAELRAWEAFNAGRS
jgi:hypothetical protein